MISASCNPAETGASSDGFDDDGIACGDGRQRCPPRQDRRSVPRRETRNNPQRTSYDGLRGVGEVRSQYLTGRQVHPARGLLDEFDCQCDLEVGVDLGRAGFASKRHSQIVPAPGHDCRCGAKQPRLFSWGRLRPCWIRVSSSLDGSCGFLPAAAGDSRIDLTAPRVGVVEPILIRGAPRPACIPTVFDR